MNLLLDVRKIAEAAGHDVDDVAHWVSAHMGEVEALVTEFLGQHTAALSPEALKAAPEAPPAAAAGSEPTPPVGA